MQGQVAALQEALQQAGGAAQASPMYPVATPAAGGRISPTAMASLVDATPSVPEATPSVAEATLSDARNWQTQMQRTGPQELSFASPSSRGDSALLTRQPSVTGLRQTRPVVTPLSAHISSLHHRINTPVSAAARARLGPGSAPGSASSLSRGWNPSAWNRVSAPGAAAGTQDQSSTCGSSGAGQTPMADLLNPLFDDSPSSSHAPAGQAADAGASAENAPADRQEDSAFSQDATSHQTADSAAAAADHGRSAQAELQARLTTALQQNEGLSGALDAATAAAQAARAQAAAAGENADAAQMVSAELSLQLEAVLEQLSLVREEARRLTDAHAAALAPCNGQHLPCHGHTRPKFGDSFPAQSTWQVALMLYKMGDLSLPQRPDHGTERLGKCAQDQLRAQAAKTS